MPVSDISILLGLPQAELVKGKKGRNVVTFGSSPNPQSCPGSPVTFSRRKAGKCQKQQQGTRAKSYKNRRVRKEGAPVCEPVWPSGKASGW